MAMEDDTGGSRDEDAADLLSRQRSYFRAGTTRPVEFRREALRSLEATLQRHEEEILAALASDLGKPGLEAYVSEYHFLLVEIRHAVRHLARWARPRRVGTPLYFRPGKSEVRRAPFGVVLVVAPWNYPLQLALSPVIAAVAAGNCVTVKPSELAPATSRLIETMLGKAFAPGHVTTVQGGAEVAEGLLEQRYDMLFFTGSGRVGRLVSRAASDHLVPAVLELGGKCPCVVDADVDIASAAERIAGGKFFNGGQTCMAPDFVVVHRTMHSALVAQLREILEAWYGETGREDMARIANERHYERLRSRAGPEEIRIGEDDETGLWLAPRLLPEVDWDHASMTGEIFGPVLPILAWDDRAELIRRLRAMEAPLALYVFSRDAAFREEIAESCPSGTIGFNDTMKQAGNPDLPFGGVGSSGMGRYRGEAGFAAFSYERSVTARGFGLDPFKARPPYGDRLSRLRRFVK